MVVVVSKHYPEKDWTNYEFINGKDAESIRSLEYLLPILLDDTHIVGLKSTIGHIDLRKSDLDKVADLIAEKVEQHS
jgi:hypothetical protein